MIGVADPMVPARYQLIAIEPETLDTCTLSLDPLDEAIRRPEPGQFTMLYAFGVGEVPVSVSGLCGDGDRLRHTIRNVGWVSRALIELPVGGMLGVRGPFGRGWDADRAKGGDVVVVAGGIGLAPLRPLIAQIALQRADYGAVAVVVGARRADEILYSSEIQEWRHRPDLQTEVTVDAADRAWPGAVGLVTELLPRLRVEPARTFAFVCGPEVMIRLVAQALVDQGLEPNRIEVSLERNMHCAVGLCGRCQLGPLLVCTDGPVVDWDVARALLAVRRW